MGIDPGIARALRVGRGNTLVPEGGIDLLNKRQGHEVGELQGCRRPRNDEARLRHIHVQPLAMAPAGAVDDDLDVRLGVPGIKADELLLDRACLCPVLEAHEPDRRVNQVVAGLVGKHDRPRLELQHWRPGDGRRLDDLEILRCRYRRKGRQPRQQGDGS